MDGAVRIWLCGARNEKQIPHPRSRKKARDRVRDDSVKKGHMCRNIRPLFNFDPPVTPEEVRAASIQFVRKISGFTKPSKANEAAFERAIEEIAKVSSRLIESLETTAPPKNREEEAAKAKARAEERFGARA